MLIQKGGLRRTTIFAVGLIAVLGLSTSKSFSTSPAPSILISQTPLTVAIPAHPQIVFALGNSQSMDGDLSGAIMTGSGSLGGTLATGLAASSSPANYSVPMGFTPPANPGSGGLAPYTVPVAGTLIDNSASRLNVAKAGIGAILNSYMEYADFALMDYQTADLGEYTTWAYYMSQDATGFTFTSTAGTGTVANPCYGADVAQMDAYSQSCAALLTNYGAASGIITDPYMNVAATSDDPLINDVVYAQANYQPPVCADGLPSYPDPYTTFNLTPDYNNGNVIEYYGSLWGMSGYTYACAPGMQPTNAGYVPYSGQIMYAMRGFGYDALSQSAAAGNLIVPMQSSGNTPTLATVQAALAAFTPYLQPETADPSTTEVKAVAEQSPIAGIVEGAAQYLSSGNPPSSNACAPAQYIVLVTDGLPTKALDGTVWPPLGTAAATGYGVTAGAPDGNGVFTTNDKAVKDTINQIIAARGAGIKTYVIGLGAGVNPANNPYAANTLKYMAYEGGTGNYFAASSPSDLSNDMQVILANILAATRSSASTTINTTALSSTSMAYQPSFDTSDVNQDWTGEIKAYAINPGSGAIASTPSWSAQALLDAKASGTGWSHRIIATWDPTAGHGIPFEWSSNPSVGIAVNTQLGMDLETNTADPSGEDALDYLRGDADLSVSNGGVYRNRTHILGDIVDSSPVYVGAAIGPYQSASYYSFEVAHDNRAPVLYAGANDGMLHAFDATTGNELFAYVPNGVFGNLINLTNPYYNEQHQFFDDASPTVADVQFSAGDWHTLLVSGEHAGGSTIFALDVSDPENIHSETDLANNVKWEFSDPAHMGLTFSNPVIAQTAYGAGTNRLGFTVFFGNGYNSPTERPYLYAVDPETGTPLTGTPIDLCAKVPTACDSSMPNGLSNVNVVSSMGGVGTPATTVYAGDLQGNLWRVDIHDANPDNWTVTLLFKATDPSGNPQPITTTPAVSLNPDFPRLTGTMVYVGTGQLLGSTDLNSTQIQTMYGVYDSGTNATSLTRADLLHQTLTESSTDVPGYTLRFVSGGPVSLPTQNGWYVDFNVQSSGTQTDVGERIVSDPRIIGGAVTVISVKPIPYSSTTSTIAPGNLSHANLARAAQPSTPRLGHQPTRLASLDSVGYVTRGPPILTAAQLDSARAQFASDGVYHPGHSTTRLQSIGFGTNPPPTLNSITVNPPNPSVTEGLTVEFTATGHYSDGSTRDLTTQVGWASSVTSVATIDSSGLASSSTTTSGSTQITATLGGISGYTTLTVTAPQPPPPPPTLQSITVQPNNPTIEVGQTQQFTAIGYYSNGTSMTITNQVTWSSSDTGIGSISAGGLATGVAVGSTTITATLTGISGDTTLTVTPYVAPVPPTLNSLVVTPATASIYIGNSQQFTATAYFSDGTTQDVTSSASWTSSNNGVATISGGGRATGHIVGSVTITATYEGAQGTANLSVLTPPTLMSIAVTPANATIYVGSTQQYVAIGTYSDASTRILTTSSVWSSNTTTVATITSGGGLATGLVAGTSMITATYGTVSGTATLTVQDRPPPAVLLSISVAPPYPTIDVGQTQSFVATGHYNDGTTKPLTTLASWSSSNTSIATMSSNVASGIALGTSTITATYAGVSGQATLAVIAVPPPPPPPVCPGGDVSYLMEFNFAGGAFSSPVFNYNGTDAPTSAIIPANGMLLGGVYAAGPVYNSYGAGSYGNGGNIGLVTLGDTQKFRYYQGGFHQQRYSWREIR
ncbi:MAG TPA: PilC/PilY family type IV pilus protein [Steroidobacteraceae bacterium]|nr:PilC/PilY family type IV pilus protein [Steroidobacteraceae bacterium]